MSYFPIHSNAQTIYFSTDKELTDTRRNQSTPLNNQQAKPSLCQSTKFGIDHYSWHPNSPTGVNVLQTTISSANCSNQLTLGEIGSSFQDQRLPSFNEIKPGSRVQSFANTNLGTSAEPRFITPSFSTNTPSPPAFMPQERSPASFERSLNYMDSDTKDWDHCSYNLESNKIQFGGNFNPSSENKPVSPGTNFIPYSCDFDERVIVNSTYQEPSLLRNQTLTTQTLNEATVVNVNENYQSSRNYNPRIVSATEKIRPIIFKNSDFCNLTAPYSIPNSITLSSRNSRVKQNNYCEYGSIYDVEKNSSESSFALKRHRFSNDSRKQTISDDCCVLPRENNESVDFPTDLSGNSSKKFRTETGKVATYYTSSSKVTCTRNTKIKMKISDKIVLDRHEIPPCRISYSPNDQNVVDTSTNRIHEADSSSVFSNGNAGGLLVNVNNIKPSKQIPSISPISSPECSAMNLIKYDTFEFINNNPKESSSNSPVATIQSTTEEPTDLSRCVTVLRNENTKPVSHIGEIESEISFPVETDVDKSRPTFQSSSKPISSTLKYQMNKETSGFYTVENMKLYTSAIMHSTQKRNKIDFNLPDSKSTKKVEGSIKETPLISSESQFSTPHQEPSPLHTTQPPSTDYFSVNEKETDEQQYIVGGTKSTSEDISLKNNAPEAAAALKQVVSLDTGTIKLTENNNDNTAVLENGNKLSSPNISKYSNDLVASMQSPIETPQNKEPDISVEENHSTLKTAEAPSPIALPVFESSNETVFSARIASIDLLTNEKDPHAEKNTDALPECESINCSSILTDDVQMTGDLVNSNTEPNDILNSTENDLTLPEKGSSDICKKPRMQSKKKKKSKKSVLKQRLTDRLTETPTHRSVTTQTLISIINETSLMTQCSFELRPGAKEVSKNTCAPATCTASSPPRHAEQRNEMRNSDLSGKKKPEPEIPPVKKPSKKRKDRPVTKGTRRSERQSKQNEKLNNTLLLDQRQCRICKEYLIYERSVSDQLTISVNKKRDVCSACNICFLQKPILDTDAEKRPHMCDICGQRFTRKLNLELHMVKHTGDKPFVCTICLKSYGHKSHLTRHYNSVHRGVLI